MVYMLLLALLISGLLFLLQITAANAAIETYYLSETASAQRIAKLMQDLNQYVQENALSSNDTEALAEWADSKHHVYLLLYKDNDLFFQGGEPSPWDEGSFFFGSQEIGSSDVESLPDTDATMFPLRFSDGLYSVMLYDYSEAYLRSICIIVILILCFLCFSIIITIYSRRITRSIITLSEEIAEVCSGNLEKEIAFPGNDELSALAGDINKMRISVIEQTKNEQLAWQANSDLITALSHDIRTPLTALLGYLDLAVGGQYQTEEQLQQYLAVSSEKARQIKSLIEEIFQYFLVFGQPSLEMNPEEFDITILLEQLLGEYMIRLQDIGFDVRLTSSLQDFISFRVDIIYLKRVFDNLFSNIEKHADRREKVVILVTAGETELHFLLSNSIPKIPNRVESTKIGLQTCSKIVEQLGGSFLVTALDNIFTVEFTLPL